MENENTLKETDVCKCIIQEMADYPGLVQAKNELILTDTIANDFNSVISYIKMDSKVSRADALEALQCLQSDFNNRTQSEKLEYVFDTLSGEAVTLSNAHLFTTALGFTEDIKLILLSGPNVIENIPIVERAFLEANSACADLVDMVTDLTDIRQLIYQEVGLTSIFNQAQEIYDKLDSAESAS